MVSAPPPPRRCWIVKQNSGILDGFYYFYDGSWMVASTSFRLPSPSTSMLRIHTQCSTQNPLSLRTVHTCWQIAPLEWKEMSGTR